MELFKFPFIVTSCVNVVSLFTVVRPSIVTSCVNVVSLFTVVRPFIVVIPSIVTSCVNVVSSFIVIIASVEAFGAIPNILEIFKFPFIVTSCVNVVSSSIVINALESVVAAIWFTPKILLPDKFKCEPISNGSVVSAFILLTFKIGIPLSSWFNLIISVLWISNLRLLSILLKCILPNWVLILMSVSVLIPKFPFPNKIPLELLSPDTIVI